MPQKIVLCTSCDTVVLALKQRSPEGYLVGRPPSGALDVRGVEAGDVDEAVGGEEEVAEERGHRVEVTWRGQQTGVRIESFWSKKLSH